MTGPMSELPLASAFSTSSITAFLHVVTDVFGQDGEKIGDKIILYGEEGQRGTPEAIIRRVTSKTNETNEGGRTVELRYDGGVQPHGVRMFILDSD